MECGELFISPEADLIEALKKMNNVQDKTLLVVDESNTLIGTLTDGDIRRYILKTGILKGTVKDICNKNPIVIYQKEHVSKEKLKNIFIKHKVYIIPIVSKSRKIIECISWSELLGDKVSVINKDSITSEVPAVIMAGGKGTRFRPITYVLPKPLIPIGNKTMIEHVMDSLYYQGIRKFFITINYKAELIKAYFDSIEPKYTIEFIREDKFLGTAGSLKLLANEIEGDFLVSNCDIMVNVNMGEVIDFHVKNEAMLTAITALNYHKIPYGVVDVGRDGLIRNINEKPEYTFQINTGVYVLNYKALEYIPEGVYFDMPDLMKTLIGKGFKVLSYPINEGDYLDMGQWERYKEAVAKIERYIV